jgi:predicted transport protein
MALGAEPDADLKIAFQDIRELTVEVAYPFFLELCHDYAAGVLLKEELLQAVRMVESYVFRRAVCSIPTNSLNKTFATFGRALKKDRYIESMLAHFLKLPSYRRFPDDDEFRRDLKARDLYNSRSRSYWLRRLENHDRKERVPVDEYTIEHIMPQNENLSTQWKVALGPEWERIQKTYLHTLGNLTLTGYNSEYSDRPFMEKRDMEGGFAQSPLRVNHGLGVIETWNEESIQERGRRLSAQAASIWTAPDLDPSVLEAYEPKTSSARYSIDDHPHLAHGPMREIFEVLRKQVLALDPCVNEEFLKLYLAYKAETNFVDIVPQAKRLRLSLNVGFHEIEDPRGMCKDVSGLGRWGNGDVEVGLSSRTKSLTLWGWCDSPSKDRWAMESPTSARGRLAVVAEAARILFLTYGHDAVQMAALRCTELTKTGDREGATLLEENSEGCPKLAVANPEQHSRINLLRRAQAQRMLQNSHLSGTRQCWPNDHARVA